MYILYIRSADVDLIYSTLLSSDAHEKTDPSTETFNTQHLKSTQPPDWVSMYMGSTNYQIPQYMTLNIIISVCFYLIAEIKLNMLLWI